MWLAVYLHDTDEHWHGVRVILWLSSLWGHLCRRWELSISCLEREHHKNCFRDLFVRHRVSILCIQSQDLYCLGIYRFWRCSEKSEIICSVFPEICNCAWGGHVDEYTFKISSMWHSAITNPTTRSIRMNFRFLQTCLNPPDMPHSQQFPTMWRDTFIPQPQYPLSQYTQFTQVEMVQEISSKAQ